MPDLNLRDWLLGNREEATRMGWETASMVWDDLYCVWNGLSDSTGRRCPASKRVGRPVRRSEIPTLFASWLAVDIGNTPSEAFVWKDSALVTVLASLGITEQPDDTPPTLAAERLAGRLEDADDGSEDWKAIHLAYVGAMGLTGLANRLGGDLPDLFAGWLWLEARRLPTKPSARAAYERALTLIKEPSC